MKIREYKPSDQEQVWALHVKTISENDGFTKNLSFHTDMKDIQNVYETFFVLEKNDKIIGMIAMKRVDAKTAEIKRLQVNSDYQGEGYGKALLEAALAHLKLSGYAKAILDYSAPNGSVGNLYLAHGFEITEQKTCTFGPDNEEFFMTYMQKSL